MPIYAYFFPVGKLWIEEQNNKIISLGCEKEQLEETEEKETPLIKQVRDELNEYFAKTRTVFTFPIEIKGPPFYKRVWEEMVHIPYGKTMTYQDLAVKLQTKGIRAIGGACKHNKLMLVIPCHRVIGAKGNLTGFYGGLAMKEQLLNLENNHDFISRKHE
ncbi:MAG: methylated-DNA--[protein]-cysteine S-methyltransferase [Bacilli bacterium]